MRDFRDMNELTDHPNLKFRYGKICLKFKKVCLKSKCLNFQTQRLSEIKMSEWLESFGAMINFSQPAVATCI